MKQITKGEELTSKKRELLESRIRYLERALEKLPKGKLTCARNGRKRSTEGMPSGTGKGDKKDFPGGRSKGSIEDQEKYAKWYVSTGKGRAYLPKSERALAEQLALRKLYTAQLNRLRQESELLRNYELFHEENVYSKEIECLLSQESPYYELLKNSIAGSQENDAYVKMWQEAEYQTNCAHPEHLQHKSLKGERLRSKSEVIIANALYMNHVPYRYESESVSLDSEMIQKIIDMYFPE